jgi:hypothetical protein
MICQVCQLAFGRIPEYSFHSSTNDPGYEGYYHETADSLERSKLAKCVLCCYLSEALASQRLEEGETNDDELTGSIYPTTVSNEPFLRFREIGSFGNRTTEGLRLSFTTLKPGGNFCSFTMLPGCIADNPTDS